MKARFITNAVLSGMCLIGFILLMAGVFTASNEYYDGSDNGSYYSSGYYVDNDGTIWGLIIAGAVFMGGFGLASLVMGIITLAMIGRAHQKGLGIASGVLAILGGVLGANVVVSIIGAVKE